jgi:HSP20 family protein
MDWKRLSPWNWLKKEQSGGGELPVLRRTGMPADPLSGLHHEIDRLFAQAWGDFRMSGWPEGAKMPGTLFRPSLDITESEKSYTIKAEMPGVAREDIEVSVDGDSLIMRGEKREETVREDERCHYTERSYGSFQRVLALPADADPDGLTASFSDGVLTVTVKRKTGTAVGSRRIAID